MMTHGQAVQLGLTALTNSQASLHLMEERQNSLK